MKRWLVIIAMFALVAPLAAVPEPSADELQANRRRFEQLRKLHPEVVHKLREDADDFFKLLKERRRRIVQIHKELHQESAATQARLFNVLDRYVEWLEDPKADKEARKKIAEAKDKNERLALIKDLREREWIKDQPKAVRDKIDQLQVQERKNFIAKEKGEERQRRLEWTIASRFWNELEGEGKFRRPVPTKFADLPPGVRLYVENYLQKMFLTQEEKDQLAKLDGQWPQFPMKLVELADKHPAALPGPVGPKSIAELPTKVFRDLTNNLTNPKRVLKEPLANQPAALAKALNITKNTWPEFGVELAKSAKQHRVVFDFEFLAYNYECLTKPMQEFMKNKLEPVLVPKEELRLSKANDKGWPEFPQTIQDLANSHHLHVPWFILPRVENWDNYRLQKTSSLDGFPDLPQGRLRDFALFELDPQLRANPHFSRPEDGFSNPSGHGGLENPPSDTAQLITIGEK